MRPRHRGQRPPWWPAGEEWPPPESPASLASLQCLRFALMLSLVLLLSRDEDRQGRHLGRAGGAAGAISASAGVRGLALVILVAGAGCLMLIVRTTRRRFAPIAALIGAAEQMERGDSRGACPSAAVATCARSHARSTR